MCSSIRVTSTAAASVSDVVVVQTPMPSVTTVINSSLSIEFVGMCAVHMCKYMYVGVCLCMLSYVL